jgi:hypothetical protein
MNGWVAHTSQRLFGFKHETKGEYKVFRIGGVLPKEKTPRVETANEGRFSSQICSERVDGVQPF